MSKVLYQGGPNKISDKLVENCARRKGFETVSINQQHG